MAKSSAGVQMVPAPGQARLARALRESPSAGRSQLADAVRRVARNRGAVVGAIVLLTLVVVALLAPWISPYDPILPAPPDSLRPPSPDHLMGTDALGRDIFSRIIYGTRISLLQGALTVVLAGAVGIGFSLAAAYYGGWIDMVIMRSVDILMTFPSILLALVVLTVLGPNLLNTMIAVGIAWIPTYARLTYGSVLSIKENQYVEAARVAGCSDRRILLYHILPNIAAPLIVLASLGMAFAILTAASLSFIGLGAQPPTPEWGAMAADGRNYLRRAWWVATFPGLIVMVTVLATNLLGDGLRDGLDPRMKLAA